MEYDGTADCAAEVAEDVCRLFSLGERGVFKYNGFPFELTDVAYCSEFVRECCDAAAGKWLPYFGSDARETERMLIAKGKRTEKPVRGDIVCFNRNTTIKWGHIGIFLGNGKFAENTSSRSRGPGFVINNLGELPGRVSGYYHILPERKVERITTPVKIIDIDTGAVIQKYNMIEGGDHIIDQGKVYVVS